MNHLGSWGSRANNPRKRGFGALVIFFAGLSVIVVSGCSADADERAPVDAQEGELVGLLTSPQNLKDENMVGTWQPLEPDGFVGQEPKSLTFFAREETRVYAVGCNDPEGCEPSGSWFITSNPAVSVLRGKYIQFRPEGGGEHAYFVSRRLSGEIRLVDHTSLRGTHYRNQWVRTPPLTVADLQ